MPRYHQHTGPIYPNYMSYAPQQQYYGMPPQYPGGGVPSPTYGPYQTYGRSPPAMHQYIPMVGVSVPPNYPRPNQQSPNLATPYRPPPAPAPIPPQTPSSTHSSQTLPPQTPPTPQTAQRDPSQSQPRPQPTEAPQPAGPRKPVVVLKQQPFRPPVSRANVGRVWRNFL
jgi:ubiquitin carboxyl-terminal hydrolase 10